MYLETLAMLLALRLAFVLVMQKSGTASGYPAGPTWSTLPNTNASPLAVWTQGMQTIKLAKVCELARVGISLVLTRNRSING